MNATLGVIVDNTNETTWAALVGLLLPTVAAFLQNTGWSSMVNAFVFAAVCVAAAAITEVVRLDGSWDWENWVGTLLTISAWAVASYHAYWNRSPIVEKLRAAPPFRSGGSAA